MDRTADEQDAVDRYLEERGVTRCPPMRAGYEEDDDKPRTGILFRRSPSSFPGQVMACIRARRMALRGKSPDEIQYRLGVDPATLRLMLS